MVAALPTEYGDIRRSQLFDRGFARYTVNGEPRPTDLITDVERFGTAALNPRLLEDSAKRAFVDDPGILAVVSTLSAVCVKANPTFEDVPARNIQVLYDIRELYINNLATLLREFGDPSLLQDIAEVLYGKDPGEDGPHAGRVCTGIRVRPDFGGGLYVEIPMVAASRACLVRNPESGTSSQLSTRIENNHLYVPIGDFDEKYREYARMAFKQLLQTQEAALSDEQRRWLVTHETAIAERIESFQTAGHRERIWRNWDVGERLLRVLTKAVKQDPDDAVAVGTFLSAKTLFSAIDRYDAKRGWERATIGRISSPRSLGNQLTRHREHRLLEIRRTGNTNEYKLIDSTATGPERIPLGSIEDLFQLPCLANMEERLHRENPVRKDLYNFVRMVRWLPQYFHADPNEVVEDLKAVFSRWPWYDEATTDYQIRYELDRTIDGESPLPMNCSNDDMQRYCIGQHHCPYSIYGSVPFVKSMYDRIENPLADDF